MNQIVKRIAALFCATFLSILIVHGERISESKAHLIATQRLAEIATIRTRGAEASPLRLAYQQTNAEGQADFYIYTPTSGNGFVIVAGDDCLPRILGYSTKDRFSKDSIPPQLQGIFKRYGEFISASAGRITSSGTPKTRGGTAVEPLLGDLEWGQDAPFNEYTPIVGGIHAPTGCVATAIAQIMRYHSWPPQGKGTGEFSVDGSKNKTKHSIEGNSYSWHSMLNRYSSNASKESNLAVARMMADVGAAVKMNYTKNESSAFSMNAGAGLIYNFQYSNAVQMLNRMYHRSDEWERIVQEELEAGRPVYYAGGSPGGGHAFVCDGHDGHGLYHINWGWDGVSNGYYALTEMLPGVQGTGAGSGGGYITGQEMIVGVQPNYVKAQRAPLFYCEEFKLSSKAANSAVAKLRAYKYIGTPLSGKLGVIVTKGADTVARFTAKTGATNLQFGYGPSDGDIQLTNLSSLAPGSYRVYPAFYSDAKKWIRALQPLNEPQFYTLTIDNNGVVTIGSDNSHTVKLTATSNTTTLYGSSDFSQNVVSITFTNNGQYPYNGQIGCRLVYDENYSDFPKKDLGVYYTNSFIEPGKSVTFSTIINNVSAYDRQDLAPRILQVLYDNTNDRYDANDNLYFMPHHVLRSIPISVKDKSFDTPLCKITSNVPATCAQMEELSININIKLNHADSYFAGAIALQYINENGRIEGGFGEKMQILRLGPTEETLTFKGKVTVPEGSYTLSVGVLMYSPKDKRKLWYTARPQTPKAKDEIQRKIKVTSAPQLPTLPVVIHFAQQPTAVENPKIIPLQVQPNPVRTQLRVQAGNGHLIARAALYSLGGQCVKRVALPVSDDHASIDVSQVPEGLYILYIEGSEGTFGSANVIIGSEGR